MAGIRIRNKEDFERWLNGIADENQRRRVATALASRAAMRMLPVTNGLLEWNEENSTFLIINIFKLFSTSFLYMQNDDVNIRLMFSEISENTNNILMDLIGWKDPADIFDDQELMFAIEAVESALFASLSGIGDVSYATAAVHTAVSIAGNEQWEMLSKEIAFGETYGWKQFPHHPLWPQDMPEWTADLWQSMKSRLLAREGEHWEVWTNWYDARLDPSRPIPCYSPYIPELERQRVLLPEDLWKQGPAAANAAIKQLIENHGCSKKKEEKPPSKETTDRTQEPATPEIPQQEPATIKVEWVGERLTLKPRPLQAAGMSDAELLATLQALGKQVRQLAQLLREDSSANAIDQRITQQLKELVELIPQRTPIDESAAIQLALQVEELRTYFGGMSEEERQGWPEILRRKLETQLQIFHAFLDRFRTWEKVDEENAQSLSDAEIEAAQDIADEVSRGLEELGEERVDPDIVQLLRRLKERLANTQASALRLGKVIKERAADLLKSLGNIFKAIGGWLVRKLTTFGRALDKAIDRELKKLAQQLAKWGRRIIFPGSPLAAGGYIAQKFGWLASLLQWLKDYFPALF